MVESGFGINNNPIYRCIISRMDTSCRGERGCPVTWHKWQDIPTALVALQGHQLFGRESIS